MNVNQPQGPRLPGMKLRDTGTPSNVSATQAIAPGNCAPPALKTSAQAVSPALYEQAINVHRSHSMRATKAMRDVLDTRATIGESVAKNVLNGSLERSLASRICGTPTTAGHAQQQRKQRVDDIPAHTVASKGGSIDGGAGKTWQVVRHSLQVVPRAVVDGANALFALLRKPII